MGFNHNQKKFIICKSIILLFSDCSCHVCGHVSILNHVHHIDKNSDNNDLFNLVCLCSECHKNAHKNMYQFQMIYTLETIQLFKKFNSLISKFN